MRSTYNKLVRDNIPNIIEKSGKTCKICVLDEESYKEALKQKLIEEANEVASSVTESDLISEIGDVLELIDALKKVYHLSDDEIEMRKGKKAQSNGRFDKRLMLEYVDE